MKYRRINKKFICLLEQAEINGRIWHPGSVINLDKYTDVRDAIEKAAEKPPKNRMVGGEGVVRK